LPAAAGDDVDNPADFICPVCAGGQESVSHFLLECPGYTVERELLFNQLQQEMEAE
jgi:hypothetical protein